MSNYYRTLLTEQLETLTNRKQAPLKRQFATLWTKVPNDACPTRPRAKRAVFCHEIFRRRGYLANLSPENYLNIAGQGFLKPEVEVLLEENWLRGDYWLPLRLLISPTDGKKDYALAAAPFAEDIQAAYFLARKKVNLIRVQLLIAGDKPATREGLQSLIEQGVFPDKDKVKEAIQLTAVEVCL